MWGESPLFCDDVDDLCGTKTTSKLIVALNDDASIQRAMSNRSLWRLQESNHPLILRSRFDRITPNREGRLSGTSVISGEFNLTFLYFGLC
jgi:hypothetical protein